MTKPITRRTLLKGAILAGGGMAVGSNLFSPGGFSAFASSIRRGGIWRDARSVTLPNLDAHRVNVVLSCIGSMFDCLVDTVIDPATHELKLVPGLATDWHPEQKGKRFIFNLRKGVRFHDGTKFDAQVAKWNLDRIRNHPKSFMKLEFKEIESVEVLNEYTLAVNLAYPLANLLVNLSTAMQGAGMVSMVFQEKHGDDELARKGIGTGAFRLKNWIADEKVVLERFPDYWKQGTDGKALPYLDGMEYHYRPELTKALVDLRTGSLDTIEWPAERDINLIRKNPDLEYLEFPPHEYQRPCLGLNSRQGPFKSHALRQAACYAIDREKMARLLSFGAAKVHQYPYISPGQAGWAPRDWPDYSFNLQKARELVKVDYPRGVTVNLLVISREPDTTIGELLKAMWEAVGIKTEMQVSERLGWIASMKKDTYEAGFWGSLNEAGGFVRYRFQSKAPGNWGNFSHPKVDQLLDQHIRTLDRSQRHEIMKELLKIVYESAELACAYSVLFGAATRKNVKGLRSAWRHLVASEVWLA